MTTSDDKRDVQQYIHSPESQQKLYKKTMFVVVMSQIFGGLGLAAGITVGALIAEDMLGTTSYAGLPAALFTLGSALSAFLVGRLSQRFGRRFGLSLGFLAGGVGAFGVIMATVSQNVWLLFITLFVYGAGTSTNLQARYAGADLATDKQRATAISIAMVSTTFGAVAGPNLVTPMGRVAESIGIPPLAGPFILAAFAYTLAGLVLYFYLRPDPLLVAQAIQAQQNKQNQPSATAKTEHSSVNVDRVSVFVGALVLVLSHVVMVAIMTMTPIHMKNNGSGLSAVGLVIGLHVAAMYLPSIITGRLVDTVGRKVMVVASGITLAVSGVMVAFVPGHSLFWMTVALVLLGIGWNFGLISGTAMIVDATDLQTRAKTQGAVDVWVALGGTAGSLLSGVIVAYSSFAQLGFIGMYLSILLLPLIWWARLKENRKLRMSS